MKSNNPIIQYLLDPFIDESVPSVEINKEKLKESVNLINEIFRIDESKREVLKIKGKKLKTIRKRQVWSVKQRYTDILGNQLQTPYPMFVVIESAPWKMFNTKFVRAYNTSPYIEMASGDFESDVIVTNEAILGYPFLVELFNGFPMHIDLLDMCFGTINIDEYKNLSEAEQEKMFGESFPRHSQEDLDEFRKVELRNRTYLSNSAMAYFSL